MSYVDPYSSDPDQVCPYNRSHIVPSKRFAAHIVKCSKVYSNSNLIICPFNAKHRIEPHLMHSHINYCLDMIPGILDEAQMKRYEEMAKQGPPNQENS